mmetsp:Transcript_21360/g.44472  ORF Transcript_21360/g.44472 Transcript_21360/m.44472 type:complete len:105 (+) Transcript_21360:183-497(+)
MSSTTNPFSKPESVSEKAARKFKEQPLVPIGCMITVGFLASGLKSFRDGKAARSQQMMRGRVAAQGVTVAAIIGYAALNGFKFFPDKPETSEERNKRILDPNRR